MQLLFRLKVKNWSRLPLSSLVPTVKIHYKFFSVNLENLFPYQTNYKNPFIFPEYVHTSGFLQRRSLGPDLETDYQNNQDSFLHKQDSVSRFTYFVLNLPSFLEICTSYGSHICTFVRMNELFPSRSICIALKYDTYIPASIYFSY